jgi:putative transposase
MFQDEGRFGTMTTLSRAWAEKGRPFVVKTRQGRENVHAYFAVDPQRGEAMLSINPLVDTETMASFLAEVRAAFPERKVLMFLDQAGWHVAKKLAVPRGITISYLPPRSPELNPVELLWRHVRQGVMHNRVFDSLAEVLDALDEALMGLGSDDLKRICTCGYL